MPNKVDRRVGVTIEGLDEIEQMLNNLTKDGADKAIRKALRAGAKVMQSAIEENAPTRIDPLTPGSTGLPEGALAHDINIGNVKSSDKQSYSISIGPGKYTAHVAMFVEYGHNAPSGSTQLMGQAVKLTGSGSTTPGHPFLRPAWDSAEGATEAAITTSLEADIDKAIDGDGSVAETEVA